MPWESFYTQIVGVTFPNDDGSSRQDLLAKCGIGQKLDLVLKPTEQDETAVAVLTQSEQQLGWLSREVAKEIAPLLRRHDYMVKAQIAELTGGGWWLFKKTRGCNILVTKWVDN